MRWAQGLSVVPSVSPGVRPIAAQAVSAAPWASVLEDEDKVNDLQVQRRNRRRPLFEIRLRARASVAPDPSILVVLQNVP